MDTSKEYIEMCEKAGEIQNPHKLCSGDWFADKKGQYCFCNACLSSYMEGDEIYLPRQDQLQKMLDYRYPTDYAFNIGEWLKYLGIDQYNQVNLYSMEQIWLAFVMKEKYNKIWNGEDWNTDGE